MENVQEFRALMEQAKAALAEEERADESDGVMKYLCGNAIAALDEVLEDMESSFSYLNRKKNA